LSSRAVVERVCDRLIPAHGAALGHPIQFGAVSTVCGCPIARPRSKVLGLVCERVLVITLEIKELHPEVDLVGPPGWRASPNAIRAAGRSPTDSRAIPR
jgi:hypothetical protein